MRLRNPGVCLLGLAALPVLLAQDTGQRSYETRCARCHGGNAAGGESGPNILDKITGRNDADLAAFIRTGSPANGMPAINVPAAEMTALVAHLRTLSSPIPRNTTSAPSTITVRLTNGQSLTGTMINEGVTDLQLRTADRHIHLLRRAANNQFREVTSQTDWPTYNGVPGGNRYSTLTQINKGNVAKLAPAWIFPIANARQVENTPLVVQGIMYLSSANECWALDAGTGRELWHFNRPRTQGLAGNAAIGFNRGVAWAGDRIFMISDNAHLLALNRWTGAVEWETEMADWHQNYNGTAAPLVVGNLVISGTAGGDEGVRGFVAAYDVATGKEAWRKWTVPRPGQPGAEEVEKTWQGAEADHRAGATWMTGSYDPALDTVYWQVGNPGPDFNGANREGDNLYSDSVLALDAKTGALKWYFQFTPHDVHDWDAQEPLVLVDTQWEGQPRKLLLQANRNGFFYVLDRTDGKLLLAKSFLKKLNWATGIGPTGRPQLANLPVDANGGTYVCPGFQGGTNWFSSSFNPATGFYYFNALERCNIFTPSTMEWQAGRGYMGGAARPAPGESFEKSMRAVNIRTGEIAFDVPQYTGQVTASAGVISTAAGIVFFGENNGAFMAVDAANGKPLWSFPTNQVWKASPMTYQFDGKQYLAIAVGSSMMTFAVPE